MCVYNHWSVFTDPALEELYLKSNNYDEEIVELLLIVSIEAFNSILIFPGYGNWRDTPIARPIWLRTRRLILRDQRDGIKN